MINTEDFYNELTNNSVDFFAGVPDSLLKDICAYITDNTAAEKNIITANEGGAIALGAGYYLATGKIPLVYMQNSGIGNAINPLLSLADKEVYSIPMILLIGWRGEPDIKDEPQHKKQGRVTLPLLDAMEINYLVIDENSDYKSIIENSVQYAQTNLNPTAIVVRKNTFESYKLKNKVENTYTMTREDALKNCLEILPENATIVSTTGMLSRELFELRESKNQGHNFDFLTVGSMGHASHIALGIALAQPNKEVYCFEGDGAALMHLGGYSIIGELAPKNLKIILFNNGAHDSVGGQPTVAHKFSISETIKTFNIKSFGEVATPEQLSKSLTEMVGQKCLSFVEIRIKQGSRKELGRPTKTTFENKIAFMNELQK